MKFSLRARLSASYIFIAVISILLISFLSNGLLEILFRQYILNEQEKRSNDLVHQITQQYIATWDVKAVESIGIHALEQGMIIRVVDDGGNVVWNARNHNSGLCDQMLEHMAQNMNSRYDDFEGSYKEGQYDLIVQSQRIGTINIGYYGPYYFNDNDIYFLNTLNLLFLGVGVVVFLLAILFGWMMSKGINAPIINVVHRAKQLSNGNYDENINITSNIQEIEQLTGSMNQLASSLKEQELMRKRLTSDVAHELRTPLATLQSHLEAMIDGIWEPEIRRLQSCYDEILRINSLINNLEKLTKIENENLILEKQKFNIYDVIKHTVQYFDIEANNKKIVINVTGQSISIIADKDKIGQVITNLLSNALKYTPIGGQIDIDVYNEAHNVRVEIKDNGIGISPRDIRYIFERFYRVDKSRNRHTGGSGIGLTITKAIVESHNGKIGIKSRVGEGTAVSILLPM
ncbi:MAG: ATP-binding protein [Eubacteriales bacterium]